MTEMSRPQGAPQKEDRFGNWLVLFATIVAGLFTVMGFIVFFGAWSSAEELVGDDVWAQLSYVGEGAIPYLIAGGVFWLLAEYKTNNPTP
ncbi:MAG TPA: hypothetical protein VK960_10855 [Acidimicrobiia bacterium]|nr:hypothetical protein [Acidimicrobiia bacterium]